MSPLSPPYFIIGTPAGVCVLAMLYSKEARSSYESLSKSSQVLQAARAELLRYLQSNAAGPQPSAALLERQKEGVCGEGPFQDVAVPCLRWVFNALHRRHRSAGGNH